MADSIIIDTLVFEGGGVKGTSYGGALRALHEFGLYKTVKRVSGTSAGAITALLVACKYTPDELTEFLISLDMSEVADDSWFLGKDMIRVVRNYGFYRGDALRALIEERVAMKTGNSQITLRELYNLTGVEFTAVAVNLNTRSILFMNHKTCPDMPAALAALASSSIPFAFPPVEYNGDLYVDGAAICNFPIDYYDGDGVLGFRVRSNKFKSNKRFHTIIGFTKAVVNAVFQASSSDLTNAKVIEINTGDVSALDFDMTLTKKQALHDSGYDVTKEYISKLLHDARYKGKE
jgi:predicted acylesterase/phospholipase RssA